jgi:hypothetical protein
LAGKSHYGIWNRLFTSMRDLFAVRWMQNRSVRYKIAERINFPSPEDLTSCESMPSAAHDPAAIAFPGPRSA